MSLVTLLAGCVGEQGASKHRIRIFAQTDIAHALLGNADGCGMQQDPDEIWIQRDHIHDLSVVTMETRGQLAVQTANPAVATVDRVDDRYRITGRGLGVSDLQVVHTAQPAGSSRDSGKPHNDTVIVPVRGISPRVTVVGWIDSDAINLDEIAPNHSRRLRTMLESPAQCLFLVMQWAASEELGPFAIDKPQDALYAKAYLVKASGNARPDQTLPPDYAAQEDYKLLNEFQTSASASGQFEHVNMSRRALVGRTKDPCGLIRNEAARYRPFTLQGEVHDLNGDYITVDDGSAVVQINQARINEAAQAVERNLTDPTKQPGEVTPWIYSAIRFDKTGRYTVCTQRFPSYSIYVGGNLVEERKQSNLADFLKLDHTSQTDPGLCK